MEHVFKMRMVNLGSLNLLENLLNTGDGMKACHDYGKALAAALD
jgi:hypothetical protein